MPQPLAGALPDAAVRHNLPERQLEHLEEGILSGPDEFAAMAAGAFPEIYVSDLVRLAALL
jgi:hypothetical protein